MGRAPVCWYTNLDIRKRHENLFLYRRYADDPSRYPKYDNYDAIEVSKVKDIPEDYWGVMGVPITFMDKYNPDQFEILGCTESKALMPGVKVGKPSQALMEKVRAGKARTKAVPNSTTPCWIDSGGYANVGYHRILIRRRP